MSARVALIIADVHVRFFSPFINLSGFTYLNANFLRPCFMHLHSFAAAAEGRTRATFFHFLRRSDVAFPCATVKAARTSCHTRPHFGRFAVHENNLLIARRETRAHTSGLQTSNSPSRGLKSCGLSGSYAELFVSRVLRAASPVVSFHSLLRNYFAVARRRGRRLRPAARYTFPCRSCGVHGFLRQDVA